LRYMIWFKLALDPQSVLPLPIPPLTDPRSEGEYLPSRQE
jgi:hypothetical protein